MNVLPSPDEAVVVACCGGHRPAGECCWKCPTCAPQVADRLDALGQAMAAALLVEFPSRQGVLT